MEAVEVAETELVPAIAIAPKNVFLRFCVEY